MLEYDGFACTSTSERFDSAHRVQHKRDINTSLKKRGAMAQTKSFQKLRTQAKADMQHHMNILQSRLAKAENHEVRADRAEQAQRNMAAEIKRLRAALQRIADQDVDADLKGQADILAGIAWAALDAAPSPC